MVSVVASDRPRYVSGAKLAVGGRITID